jgi:hypothetical protein
MSWFKTAKGGVLKDGEISATCQPIETVGTEILAAKPYGCRGDDSSRYVGIRIVPLKIDPATMAFLNKIKRGSHAITIDHDLSVGMSRNLFVLDEVLSTVPGC